MIADRSAGVIEAEVWQRRKDELVCSGKRRHTASSAWDTVLSHYACFKCSDGREELGVFRCPADPSHYHTGHTPKGVRR